MKSGELKTMVGTLVLTIASAMPYTLGILAMWENYFIRLPLPVAVIVTIGLIVAPIQLVRDIIEALERDRKKTQEKIEDLEI